MGWGYMPHPFIIKTMNNWKVKIKDTLHNLGIGDQIRIRGWAESLAKIIKVNEDGSALVDIENMQLTVNATDVDSVEPKEEKKDDLLTIPKDLLEDKTYEPIFTKPQEEAEKVEAEEVIDPVTNYSAIPPHAWEGIAKTLGELEITFPTNDLEVVAKANAWSRAQHHMVQYMKGHKKDVDGQDHLAKSIINLLILYNNELKNG